MAVNVIFLILFLLSSVLFIVGLIKPTFFDRFFEETQSRKRLSLIFVVATALFFILFGITIDTSSSTNKAKVGEEKQEVESATTSPSIEPSPSPEVKSESIEITPTPTPKNKVFSTPTPTLIPTPLPTLAPTPAYIPPTPAPTTSSTFSCDCSKTCTQIASCEEAYYQLNACGCNIRDGDNDGVPCENLCPGG